MEGVFLFMHACILTWCGVKSWVCFGRLELGDAGPFVRWVCAC